MHYSKIEANKNDVFIYKSLLLITYVELYTFYILWMLKQPDIYKIFFKYFTMYVFFTYSGYKIYLLLWEFSL